MAEPEPHLSPTFSELKERRLVFLLCCVAAIHVFIFAAAFPFFNVADEWAHFDLAVKYSHGRLPYPEEGVSAEAVPYLVLYHSPEYLWPSNDFPVSKFPPFWTQPLEKIAPVVSAQETELKLKINFETSQPPLYYLLTGLWWRVAKACGFHDGPLLYSLRFLNCFFIAALVWLAFAAARLVFPGQRFLQLSVPALLAFMPQTAFYSIQNDTLSALAFGAAFICLIYLLRAQVPSVRLGVGTGFALAATFLTNLSSLPLLALSGLVVLLKVWQLLKSGRLRSASPALLALVLCAGSPIIAWLAWCKHAFGDFTGTAAKVQYLGWTVKPFSQWWHHPIFTPQGLWTFVSGLMATLWQGGLLWHDAPLACPAVNGVYAVLSVGLIGAAVIALLSRFPIATQPQRQVLILAGGYCLAAVAFLALLSIIYDFHDCFYPSRAHPFFDSGRLMLGALIPFLLLYVYGLDRVLGWINVRWIKPAVLAGMILFMLISEITVDRPVFSSQYNWFHM